MTHDPSTPEDQDIEAQKHRNDDAELPSHVVDDHRSDLCASCDVSRKLLRAVTRIHQTDHRPGEHTGHEAENRYLAKRLHDRSRGHVLLGAARCQSHGNHTS
ncbi:hypothetical protein CMS1430 [Clavibacter sepedonicus]|uniref:Uncharacterized protein n=1 Tax=Clavibacter sepedonicus TaxID=31964 RepID=B0RIQ0_CLASE|nr:hypothetical protein CMS1430 [Clavibacter sepedonicus]